MRAAPRVTSDTHTAVPRVLPSGAEYDDACVTQPPRFGASARSEYPEHVRGAGRMTTPTSNPPPGAGSSPGAPGTPMAGSGSAPVGEADVRTNGAANGVPAVDDGVKTTATTANGLGVGAAGSTADAPA